MDDPVSIQDNLRLDGMKCYRAQLPIEQLLADGRKSSVKKIIMACQPPHPSAALLVFFSTEEKSVEENAVTVFNSLYSLYMQFFPHLHCLVRSSLSSLHIVSSVSPVSIVSNCLYLFFPHSALVSSVSNSPSSLSPCSALVSL